MKLSPPSWALSSLLHIHCGEQARVLSVACRALGDLLYPLPSLTSSPATSTPCTPALRAPLLLDRVGCAPTSPPLLGCPSWALVMAGSFLVSEKMSLGILICKMGGNLLIC